MIELSTTALPKVRREARVELRKARLGDVDEVYALIRHW
ncbi:MAG: GNAT family N-acetyltransferase, partial [Thermus sp.]